MKIGIVGGGTSGYLTALTMQHNFPEHDITLIENSTIGTIGVGESTTGSFLQTIKNLDIDLVEFMKFSNCTIKVGNLFCGWNDENVDYFLNIIRGEALYNRKYHSLISSAIKNDNSLSKIDESSIFAIQNKIPSRIGLDNNVYSGVNLDSVLCSKYLKSIAVKRKINIIDDFVVGFESDKEDITNIILSNSSLKVDFVFDCSGFNRLVIGKFYKQNWISVFDTLPINQSIVGQVPLKDNLPPYVKTTALDYGWSFQIPTNERYGVGYNFDSNYLSEEDAIIELKNKIDKNWEPAKSIKYNTGFYENQSIGNCMAVGLSGSFFEPMEASSLMTTTFILDQIIFRFPEYFVDKNSFIKNINNDLKNIQKDIISAIYIHYVTNKTNNDFWKNFTQNNKMPEQVQKFLETMELKMPDPNKCDFVYVDGSYYNDYFIKIYYGNGLRNKNIINNHNDELYYKYINILNKRDFNWKDHREMIDSIKA